MTDITVLINRYKKRLEYIQREAAKEVAHKMVDFSPVLSGSFVLSLTGTLNGNGYNDVSLPVPDEATLPYGLWNNPREGSYKSTAKGRVDRTLARMKVGDSYTFINRKIYGPVIEYEGHSYAKAPSGMRDRAVSQWQRVVDRKAGESHAIRIA